MKRILVFGITENPGGIESFIMSYYRKIDRSKFQFDFLCNTKLVAYEDEILNLGGKIYRICARSENRKQYKNDMKMFFKQHSKEYDAVWENVCSLANIDYLKYAKKYGIKRRIIHSHNSNNMDSKLRGLLHAYNKRRIDKYATDFWACSKEASDWFYNGSISDKVIIIPNAIDVKSKMFDQIKRRQIRKQYGLENNLIIGNIGRLHFQKNQEFAIDIFERLYIKDDRFRLVLIGQGEYEEKLKEKVKRLKLDGKVLFVGASKDIQGWLSAFDLFLFPSLFEGLGIALLEAQANGLPVVCSSDSIPHDVKVNDNFSFISLEEGVDNWTSLIEEKVNDARLNENAIIKNFKEKGFDIDFEVERFESNLDKYE